MNKISTDFGQLVLTKDEFGLLMECLEKRLSAFTVSIKSVKTEEDLSVINAERWPLAKLYRRLNAIR